MRRSLLAVGLTAALLAPTASQPTGLGSFWAVLASLWSAASLDEGCGADPDGWCSQTHLATDAGCGADPIGLCRKARPLQTDEGCGADPSGRCSQSQQLDTDAGCGFDPFGRCSPAR